MKFRKKFANFIVDARWYFFAFFIILTIASVFLIPNVGINYDLSKYLPNDSETKISLKLMENEFGASGSASVMISNTNIEEISGLITKIENIDGVSSIVFNPADQSYYKDNNGLLKIFFDSNNYTLETSKAIEEINKVCENYETAMAGSAVDATSSRGAIGNEMIIILLIAVAIVLVVLTLTSKSWLEPLVYLIVIGCAILINMGSNLILGEISFVTQSISAIMLIALEMDYCIVLCSRYREEESKGLSKIDAMKSALSGSFTAIIASSCTVMAGLIALMFMDFTIGFDIGAVLAKGVFISILAVLFFMPSIILMFSKLLEKTKHKNFLPKMDKLGSFANKTKIVIPVIFACIVCCAVILQSSVSFSYYSAPNAEWSKEYKDNVKIERTFGKQNTLVVMVPNSNIDEELKLYNDISKIEIKGENYINSKSSIVDTPFYSKLTAENIKTVYGLDDATIQAIFTNLNTDINSSIYLIDLITYLHTNNNVINNIATVKQQNIDNIYNAFTNMANNNLYAMLNVNQAQNIYNLSNIAIMQNIFATILNTNIENIGEKTLPNWAIIECLYSQDIEGYNAKLSPIITNQLQPFKQLTSNEVHITYGLPNNVIEKIYNGYNLDSSQKIRVLQVIEALHQKINNVGIINSIASETQKQVDSGYNLYLQASKMFESENYHRMIFNLNLDITDANAIAFIEELNTMIKNYDFEKCYIVNETNNLIDTEQTFKTDKLKTDLITILAILLIVVCAFRSFSIPLLLVLTIQGAIWINIAINNLAGNSIYFICYLLAMAIQMGATIDYGILLTDRYTKFREKYSKLESIKMALNTSITTILTSGSILIFAAFTIHFISSTPLIAEIGLLIGRGALISVLAILFVLPQLLLLFDKFIEKTTYKKKFYNEEREIKDNVIENNINK